MKTLQRLGIVGLILLWLPGCSPARMQEGIHRATAGSVAIRDKVSFFRLNISETYRYCKYADFSRKIVEG